jgi:hypothetical protein
VRELTGSARAAFVAGLFFAFFPYRLGQFPHIQTISSQWMPFALYGFRRYFDTGRTVALVAGTSAFVVQGLSSGYYLFYLAPVLLAYVVWEMAQRGRLGDLRTWLGVGAAGSGAVLCTLPFLLPYAEAKAQSGYTRPYGEVLGFSADLYAYLNTPPQVWLWGAVLNRFPQPEGDLFPGAVPLLLGCAAVMMWAHAAWMAARNATRDASARERRVGRILLSLAALGVLAAGVVTVTGGFVWNLGGLPIRMTNVRRTLLYAGVCVAAACWLSPRLRTALRTSSADLTPFLVLAMGFSVIMSLGPLPRAAGRLIVGLGLYDGFFTLVPGYDGLRAPARFGMVAGLMLAVLAGYALARLARWPRGGTLAVALTGTLFLAEAFAAPMPMNLSWTSSARYAAAWPNVHRLNDGPLAYRHLLAMPDDTIVLEMPFGDQAWDLRYVYYAGLHGKRIVNGYSGYFPDGYRARASRLSRLWDDRTAAWDAVVGSGATHLLIQRDGFPAPEGGAVIGWAHLAGAVVEVEFADGDVLLARPR